MKFFFLKILVIVVAITYLSGCGEGIEPDPEIEGFGFSGRVIFLGEWPSEARQTYVILFKNPLIQESDFSALNLRYVSLEIPNGTSQFSFNSEEKLVGNVEPGDYGYFAVAQSDSSDFLPIRSAWRVVGLYYPNSDSSNAGHLSLPDNQYKEDIVIICDYENPPPQPPGG